MARSRSDESDGDREAGIRQTIPLVIPHIGKRQGNREGKGLRALELHPSIEPILGALAERIVDIEQTICDIRQVPSVLLQRGGDSKKREGNQH